MIQKMIDRIRGKRRSGTRRPRVHPEDLKAIGCDEALLYEAIRWNVNENDRALYNLLNCATGVKRTAESIGEDLAGKTILEIGTSKDPGLPVILRLSGCGDYYANNIFDVDGWLPRPYIDLVNLIMSGVLGGTVRSVEDVVKWETRNGDTPIGVLREEWFHNVSPTPVEQLRLPDESVDMAFSVAVLEHVKHPQPVLDNSYRMLKPGAWCSHGIDLRDHRDFDRPLEFLKLGEDEYLAGTPGGENRWRASDFLEAFRNSGFDIVSASFMDRPMTLNADGKTDVASSIINPARNVYSATRLEECSAWVTEEMRATFRPPFDQKSLEDLSVLSMSVLARKPARVDGSAAATTGS